MGRDTADCGSATHPGGRATPEGCSLVRAAPHAEYAYLLGQYLGDGHIAHNHRGVYRLEIACCATYPDIIEECALAMARVLPTERRGPPTPAAEGVVCVGCYSKHLPHLFPQHGTGPKHRRSMVLERWQEDIALDECPQAFLRGLLHSDGWRGINRVRGKNGTWYAYPRYQFSNRSDDIREQFGAACDRVGVEWTRMNAFNISVAGRQSVERLDEFVGPKS